MLHATAATTISVCHSLLFEAEVALDRLTLDVSSNKCFDLIQLCLLRNTSFQRLQLGSDLVRGSLAAQLATQNLDLERHALVSWEGEA